MSFAPQEIVHRFASMRKCGMDPVTQELQQMSGSPVRRRRGRKRFRVLPLDQLRGLPVADFGTAECGVYFLWGLSELLYIGKSNNVGYRLTQHRQSKYFTHMTFERIAEECVRDCERDYVLRYSPPLNRTRLG